MTYITKSIIAFVSGTESNIGLVIELAVSSFEASGARELAVYSEPSNQPSNPCGNANSLLGTVPPQGCSLEQKRILYSVYVKNTFSL